MANFTMYAKLNTVAFMDKAFTVDYLCLKYANLATGLDYATEEPEKPNIECKQFLSRFHSRV